MICYGRHAPRALAHSITMWSEKIKEKYMLIKQKTSQHGHMGDDDGYWRGACNKCSSRFI
jgi:hypothetical protein